MNFLIAILIFAYLNFCFGFALRIVKRYNEFGNFEEHKVGLFLIAYFFMPIFLGYMVAEKLWFE